MHASEKNDCRAHKKIVPNENGTEHKQRRRKITIDVLDVYLTAFSGSRCSPSPHRHSVLLS